MKSKIKVHDGMILLIIIFAALLSSCQAKESQARVSHSIPPSATPPND